MQEEISLREILQILWSKKLIILVTILLVSLVTVSVNFFYFKSEFRATAYVRVSSADAQEVLNVNQFLPYLSSAAMRTTLIKKLDLADAYSVAELSTAIQISQEDSSNVLRITVFGDDPKTIAKIANQVAHEAGLRVTVTDLTNSISTSTKRVEEIHQLLAVLESGISESEEQLKVTPEKLTLTKSVQDETVLIDGENAQLITEELNPVYINLTAKIADLKVEYSRASSEKEMNLEKIEHALEKVKELESSVYTFGSESVVGPSQLISGTNSIFITPAIEPEKPIGPRKVFNVAVSVFSSFVIGCAIALMYHYLKFGRISSGLRQHTVE